MDFGSLLDKWEKTEKGRKATSRHAEEQHRHDLQEERSDQGKKLAPGSLKKMPAQDELDLHGMTAVEAERAVMDFLAISAGKGLVKVRIIHGKGHHSSGQGPVLGSVVRKCLELSPHAGAFGTPSREEGGSGAVWVNIKKKRHR